MEMSALHPNVTVSGAREAIAYYEAALGAEVIDTITAADTIIHSDLRLVSPAGTSTFTVAEAFPPDSVAPEAGAPTHASFTIPVEDTDAAITRLQGTGHLVTGFDGSRRALAALKDATSQLIGRFTGAAQDATRALYGDGPLTRYAARLVVPDETVAEILVLKGVAVAYVMAPREQEPLYQRQREVIADLVQVFSDRAPVALEPSFAADWEAAPDDAARLRVVVDQVASLTDVSAMQFHARLVRPPA